MTDLDRMEKILWAEAKLEAFKCVKEGMLAENKSRDVAGEPLAYNDYHFFELAEKMIKIFNNYRGGI